MSRHSIPMANKYDRVVLLVDMDCFYCQVEEKLDPSLKGKPLAVVQYNAWRGGGIIAVNYAARAKGVTRHMRGDEARAQCPDIQLAKVPNIREKADLTKYREAGKDVANVLQRFTPLLERASVDEAYLDITDFVNKRHAAMDDGTFILKPQELINTYAVGFSSIGEYVTTITRKYINPLLDDDTFYRNFPESDVPAVRQSNVRLLIGASIASEIRTAVLAETGYECSAGIAHNKILAKLACGMNKPNKQTILPLAQIEELFATLPLSKIKGLGAKFGEEICQRMGIRYLGQLLKFTESELQRKFDEKNGTWLYYMCRGIDLEAVTPRFYSKSIGCCKKFPGRNSITGIKTLQHWLNELANEITERLEKDIDENNRRARQMVVNFVQEFNSEEISSSRSAPLNCYDTDVLARTCLELIKSNTKQFFRSGSESVINNPIKFLGISVGKFETISNSQNKIQDMFAQQAAKKKRVSNENELSIANKDIPNKVRNSIITNGIEKKADKVVGAIKRKNDINSFFSNHRKRKLSQNSDDVCNEAEVQDTGTSETLILKNNINLNEDHENTENDTKSQHRDILENIVKTNVDIQCLSSIPSNHVCQKREKASTQINEETYSASSEIKDESSKEMNEDYSSETNTEAKVNINEKSFSDSQINEENPSDDSQNNKSNDSQRCNNNELDALINDLESMQNEVVGTKTDTFDLQTKVSAHYSKLNNKRKYNEISDESVPKADYRSEYAEFALPVFNEQCLQYTSCTTCGVKILNDPMSIQTHQDHHFAQELSQQQRLEFREEIRTKINSTKLSPGNGNKNVKRSTSTISGKKTLTAGIKKFLKPPPPTLSMNPEESIINESFVEICDICKVPIKRVEMLEHKDFHMAKDLQRKLNQLEVHTVETSKPISETSRSNLNTSLIVPSRKPKVISKPITTFFTQPNR